MGASGVPYGSTRTIHSSPARPIRIEKHWFPLLLGLSGSGGVRGGPVGIYVGGRGSYILPGPVIDIRNRIGKSDSCCSDGIESAFCYQKLKSKRLVQGTKILIKLKVCCRHRILLGT